MKNNKFMPLVKEDKLFLDSLEHTVNTVAGKEFLSKIKFKMQYEPAMANDLLLSEFDNDEGIYIVRCYDHEFIVGRHIGDKYEEEGDAMSFSQAMNVNLKNNNFAAEDVTLFQWLANRDFKGIRYNNNYDLI